MYGAAFLSFGLYSWLADLQADQAPWGDLDPLAVSLEADAVNTSNTPNINSSSE